MLYFIIFYINSIQGTELQLPFDQAQEISQVFFNQTEIDSVTSTLFDEYKDYLLDQDFNVFFNGEKIEQNKKSLSNSQKKQKNNKYDEPYCSLFICSACVCTAWSSQQFKNFSLDTVANYAFPNMDVYKKHLNICVCIKKAKNKIKKFLL